jgi:hypothetical protein
LFFVAGNCWNIDFTKQLAFTISMYLPKEKWQKILFKTLHRKLKIKQHEPHFGAFNFFLIQRSLFLSVYCVKKKVSLFRLPGDALYSRAFDDCFVFYLTIV